MTTYRHTQIGWAILIPVLFVVVIALGLMTSSADSSPGIPLAVAGLLALLFATFTVTVAGGWLECRFGIGLIRRRICLSDVQRAEAVRNKWYYGCGIRLTPHGWLWNVSGLSAVELSFTNGRRFRIGTDEPAKLLEALRTSELQARG